MKTISRYLLIGVNASIIIVLAVVSIRDYFDKKQFEGEWCSYSFTIEIPIDSTNADTSYFENEFRKQFSEKFRIVHRDTSK